MEIDAMTVRDSEAALLARCATVAREATPSARDQHEANVFRLAERLDPAEVVRKGWVSTLPRLRDRLSRCLNGH